MGAARERLEGGHHEGGRLSRVRLAHALGLEKAPPEFAVRSVRWADRQVEVRVGVGPGRDTLVYIVEGGPQVPALARTEHLALRSQGHTLPPKMARRVCAAFEARMADATMERLAGALLEDPELRAVEALPGSAPAPAAGTAAVPTPGDQEKKLGGGRRAGGQASIARFAELLGLAPTFTVESIGWLTDHVELSVSADEERSVRFALLTRSPEVRGFVKSDYLVLTYQAKDIPEALARAVAAAAPSRLAGLTMNDLAGWLLEDPELGKPGLAMPSTEHDHPANQLDTWGGEDSYADFFAGGELARGQLDSVDLGQFARNVQHCDVECLFVNPHANAAVVTLVDFPWENRVRDIGVPEHQRGRPEAREFDLVDGMVSTDLEEQDVIMGNPDKLRRVMEYATGLPNPKKVPLFVANTCVPTVTGEDVESVVKEYRKKTDFPILYLTVTPKSMNDVLVDLLVTRRLEAEKRADRPSPDSVNLVGFPVNRSSAEVREMLSHLGIGVNELFLPELEPRIIEALPRAALNVFYPNSLWSHLYEQVQQDSRIPHIMPSAPFSPASTKRWVTAVAAALGGRPDLDARFDAWMADLRPEWERAQARARRHSLGLVVRGEEIHYLLDPAQTWGIPLLELFQDAGFGVEIFLAARSERAGERLGAQVVPHFREGHDCAIHTFSSFEEMRSELRKSDCAAVLTNHFFDWRVGEAGKGRFSLQYFEPGVAGAIRSVHRIADVCETPFYSRYGRYLHRTTAGLRDPLHRTTESST